jgi:hypothetical protein
LIHIERTQVNARGASEIKKSLDNTVETLDFGSQDVELRAGIVSRRADSLQL